MRRRVSVIILCWNRWDLTSRCLESIRRCTDLTDVDVIVVDNGSRDETATALPEYAWVRAVRSETNLGFVRGNNLALTLTDPTSDVFLLNNDTEVLEPGWLERLQEAAHAAPDIGIVGCRLLHRDGVLSCAGAYLVPDTCRGHFIGVWEKDVGQYPLDRDVPTVIFAAAYIRREVVTSIGGLSEAYESYFEDTDYCLRAREAGFRTLCCGSVSILHLVAGSTAGRSELLGTLFDRSWETFRGLWQAKLLADYRFELSWHSVPSAAVRLSGLDRKMAKALDASGVRVAFSEDLTRLPGRLPPQQEIFDPYLHALTGRERTRQAISLVFGPPGSSAGRAGGYNVWFAAPDARMDPTQVRRFQRGFDEIWATTVSDRDALMAEGLTRPVHVIPLGVDTDYFHPGARAFRNPSGGFVFLAELEWPLDRPAEVLLRAFNCAFSDREAVALVCMVTNPEPGRRIVSEIAGLGMRHRGGRIRLLVNRAIPHYQRPALHRSADCYVHLDPSAGSGLRVLEAIACGLPVIASEAAAGAAAVSREAFYPLLYLDAGPTVRPRALSRERPAPDQDQLSSVLRHVFDHREEAAQRGRAAAAQVRWHGSLDRTVGLIRARLEAIAATRGVAV